MLEICNLNAVKKLGVYWTANNPFYICRQVILYLLEEGVWTLASETSSWSLRNV